jgi:calcium/calmodulin-dependent protein kinase I
MSVALLFPEATYLIYLYLCLQTLGLGSFGKVVRATWHKAPPPGDSVRPVALKVIPKKLVKGEESNVFDEIEVLKGLDHPGIVKCFDHFESRDK